MSNATIADIVAELRRCPTSTVLGGIVSLICKRLADRIETAWKREKAEVEASALAAGGIVEASRHKQGNAAAMREALEKIIKLANTIYVLDLNGVGGLDTKALAIIDKAKAALAAPAEEREWSAQKSENCVEGNAAAMRNALLNAQSRFKAIAMTNTEWRTCAESHVLEISAALSAPPRNYDVGSAEEQYKRFQDFCLHNSFRGVCSARCPLYTQCTIGSYQNTGRTICFPAWAQMPYEQEVKEHEESAAEGEDA